MYSAIVRRKKTVLCLKNSKEGSCTTSLQLTNPASSIEWRNGSAIASDCRGIDIDVTRHLHYYYFLIFCFLFINLSFRISLRANIHFLINRWLVHRLGIACLFSLHFCCGGALYMNFIYGCLPNILLKYFFSHFAALQVGRKNKVVLIINRKTVKKPVL